ncbi:hypothetical protein DFR70_109206 [Nocardia tenerifensis]|uniref:Uncharacterized protein n=1 Tax=Nocardia tenerifensis TaxID=228006 RepID=A0A318K1H6_9NOCA|nr:DUF692 domain-containing protein [Nocardia tenerifensis]PXX61015.1 hypothetical protein DFR70_109206 [Nocardia tenerifensis]
MREFDLGRLPALGVGLGYRREIDAAIMANHERIDCLEIITENFLDTPVGGPLEQLRDQFALVPHGIELSIGTEGPLDDGYLDGLALLVARVDAPWCSDHLSFTRAGGLSIGQLTPLMRTRELADDIAGKARRVQERVGTPFLLENITYHLDFPAELSEAEFITRVVERAGCGLLLDLTNVFVNATNHGYDAIEFVNSIPLERVVQMHLAGGYWSGGTLLDSHSAPVPAEVWELLDYVAGRTPALRCVILERDQDFPDDFDELTADLRRARACVGSVVCG